MLSTKTCFNNFLLRKQAERWLDASAHPDRLAASCLFRLNRATRWFSRGQMKDYIYFIKSQMIEHFYTAWFTTAVTRQIQTLYCYSCDEDGINHFGDECERCDGTHIYRQHSLYKFIFNIDGRQFVWHQPSRMIGYRVALTTEDTTEFEQRSVSGDVFINEKLLDLYMMTILVYLERQGRYLNAHPRLRIDFSKALRDDISNWWLARRWGWERVRFWYKTRRLKSKRLKLVLQSMQHRKAHDIEREGWHETSPGSGVWEEDDIPF